MKRFLIFVVAVLMIRNGEIFAQPISQNMPALLPVNQLIIKAPASSPIILPAPADFSLAKTQFLDFNLQKKPVNPLNAGFYASHLGIFCRAELQVEKAVSLPVKFRLGSVMYTDYLEQKPNAVYGR